MTNSNILPSVNPALNTSVADSASLLAPPAGYGDFLLEIKTQIRQRQFQALRAANKELLALYWWLGENISQRQLTLGWGKGVVENLARDRQAEFPGRNGFSAQNLWLMRQFFNEYADKPKLQSLIGEISWAKNLLVMGRCKDDLEREFYLRATARFGWTTKVLQHQLDNRSYAQYLNGQTNFDAAVPDSIKAQAFNNPKDLYEIAKLIRYATTNDKEALVLDFLGGSGTTGEAVMRLNAEVGGSRWFILVQIPQPTLPDQNQWRVPGAVDFKHEIGLLRIPHLRK